MGLDDSPEVVLAGSPAFLNAALPPLAAALGARPRVADAPHQVFALCQDGARLLVCEYRGQEWLPLVEDLKTTFDDDLRVLVAVPGEHATASGALLGAGADEVLPWDGKPEAVVAAAARLAGMPGAPPPVPPVPTVPPGRAAAPGPTPARPGVPPPLPTPHIAPPVPAAGSSGRSRPGPTPARPTPAVTPAVPAVTPVRAVPAVTPARGVPAVTPAPGVPAMTPARGVPAVTPARATPTVTPSPSPTAAPAPPRPALTPVRPLPAASPARPAEAAAPPAPEPAAPPALAVDAGGAALAAEPRCFADLDEDEPRFSIVEAPPDAAARWGDAELIAFDRSSTWPGTVLASRDAEGLLGGAVAGFWPEVPDLKAHTERIVADLSPLERDAIAGRPVPADPAPVCRAAALRWQVSAALATAPPPGSPMDSAAVRAILAEIDAVLAELKRASQGAPPEALAGLDRLRRDLVAEAVDLTETVHRIAPQEAPPPEEAAARAAVAGRTRLLSFQPSEAGGVRGEGRRQTGAFVALGLAAVLGAAYHGWRHFLRPVPPPMPRSAGAPAGFVAPPIVPGGARIFAPEPGKAADPAEIEKFRLTEELKGNKVQEIRGVLVVAPDRGAKAPAGAPPRR